MLMDFFLQAVPLVVRAETGGRVTVVDRAEASRIAPKKVAGLHYPFPHCFDPSLL
jgi:hypothetical protein